MLFRSIGTISPGPVLVFVIIAVIMGIVLHKTKYGRKIFLVGVNQNAGEFSGINTKRVILSTYVLSAVGAAIAGIVLNAILPGNDYEFGMNEKGDENRGIHA